MTRAQRRQRRAFGRARPGWTRSRRIGRPRPECVVSERVASCTSCSTSWMPRGTWTCRVSKGTCLDGTRRKCREWPLLHAPNSWPRRREESRTYSIIVETTYEHTRFTSTDSHTIALGVSRCAESAHQPELADTGARIALANGMEEDRVVVCMRACVPSLTFVRARGISRPRGLAAAVSRPSRSPGAAVVPQADRRFRRKRYYCVV